MKMGEISTFWAKKITCKNSEAGEERLSWSDAGGGGWRGKEGPAP